MKSVLATVFLLVVAGAAAAQPGPEPGYDSAVEYAADYAARQAQGAAADPVGTVQQKGSPEGARAEAEHAAYVACWAADDAGVETEFCDAYYTPRGEAPLEQPHDHDAHNHTEAREAAQAYANETRNGTMVLAGNVTVFVNQTFEDPGNATRHAEGLLGAVVAFVEDVVDGAADLATLIVDGLAGCLGGVGDGLGLAAGGVGDAGALLWDALWDGVGLATDGLGLGAQGVGAGVEAGFVGLSALGHGVLAVVGALGTGAMAVVDGAGHAAQALADGLADASGGAADAVGDAATATGQALADAARAVGDAIDRILGDGTAPKRGLDRVPDVGLDEPVDADGLLDGVTGLLEGDS